METYQPPISVEGWKLLVAIAAAAFSGAYMLWLVLSPRADLQEIRANYIARPEYMADSKRVEETTKRLDQRLDDIQKSVQGFDTMKSQIGDLWSRYSRERYPETGRKQ